MNAPKLRFINRRLSGNLQSVQQAFLDNVELYIPADSEITFNAGPGFTQVTLTMCVSSLEIEYEPRMKHAVKEA